LGNPAIPCEEKKLGEVGEDEQEQGEHKHKHEHEQDKRSRKGGRKEGRKEGRKGRTHPIVSTNIKRGSYNQLYMSQSCRVWQSFEKGVEVTGRRFLDCWIDVEFYV
jgi:hypothetical protein